MSHQHQNCSKDRKDRPQVCYNKQLELNYYITPSIYIYNNTTPPIYPTVTLNYEITNLRSESFKDDIVLVDSLLGSYNYGRLRLQPNATTRIDLPYTLTARDIDTKERLIGTGLITNKKGKRISNVSSNSAQKAAAHINPNNGEYEINISIVITPNPYVIIQGQPTIVNLKVDLLNTLKLTIVRDLVLVIPLGANRYITHALGQLTFGPNERKSFARDYSLTTADEAFASLIIKGFVALAHPTELYGAQVSNIATATANAGLPIPPSPCEAPAAPGVDWSGCDKSNINFPNSVNLRGANLQFTNFTNSTLINANLSGAALLGANLNGANLTIANLTFAILTLANLTFSNAPNSNLSSAVLLNANLSNANFTGANFSNAVFLDTTISGTNFSGEASNFNNIRSSGLIGTPASLPDGWSIVNGSFVPPP